MKRITLLLLLIGFNACKKSEVAPIPDPKPKAEFSFYVGADGKVGFTNLSTDATSYKWDFGDFQTRNTSDKSVFIYQYSQNKNFQVSLTSTGKGGTDVVVKNVYVGNVKGNLVVYKKFTTGQSNINVYVDGNYYGAINGSYYYSNGADCGAQYAVTINGLSEGIHKIEAKETSLISPRSWSGSTNVIGGNCSSFGLTL